MQRNIDKHLWKRAIASLIVLFLASVLSAKDFDDSEFQHITYPDWFIDNSFKDLSDDLETAIADGKKGLMVMFTTQGCSYCKMFLKVSLGNPRIARAVQRNFDSLGLEIFDDVEMTHPDGSPTRVKHFAVNEGAAIAPTLLFYGPDGKRFLKLVGYKSPEHFENIISFIEHRKSGEKFRDYLKRKAIEPVAKTDYQLKSDALFLQPPLKLEAGHNKPLLVLFEANDCLECSNFHNDVLALPEIRQQLENFNVARLDARNSKTLVTTPSGEKVTPQQWYKNTDLIQLPALVFFGDNGEFVTQTDSITRRQRMLNLMGLILDKKYKEGWNYQRYARSKAIERSLQQKPN
jgi:thioredoxin-related protein